MPRHRQRHQGLLGDLPIMSLCRAIRVLASRGEHVHATRLACGVARFCPFSSDLEPTLQGRPDYETNGNCREFGKAYEEAVDTVVGIGIGILVAIIVVVVLVVICSIVGCYFCCCRNKQQTVVITQQAPAGAPVPVAAPA